MTQFPLPGNRGSAATPRRDRVPGSYLLNWWRQGLRQMSRQTHRSVTRSSQQGGFSLVKIRWSDIEAALEEAALLLSFEFCHHTETHLPPPLPLWAKSLRIAARQGLRQKRESDKISRNIQVCTMSPAPFLALNIEQGCEHIHVSVCNLSQGLWAGYQKTLSHLVAHHYNLYSG